MTHHRIIGSAADGTILIAALAEVDRMAAAARQRHATSGARFVASPLEQVPYQPMIAGRDPRWERVLESIAIADEQEAADREAQ